MSKTMSVRNIQSIDMLTTLSHCKFQCKVTCKKPANLLPQKKNC